MRLFKQSRPLRALLVGFFIFLGLAVAGGLSAALFNVGNDLAAVPQPKVYTQKQLLKNEFYPGYRVRCDVIRYTLPVVEAERLIARLQVYFQQCGYEEKPRLMGQTDHYTFTRTIRLPGRCEQYRVIECQREPVPPLNDNVALALVAYQDTQRLP